MKKSPVRSDPMLIFLSGNSLNYMFARCLVLAFYIVLIDCITDYVGVVMEIVDARNVGYAKIVQNDKQVIGASTVVGLNFNGSI